MQETRGASLGASGALLDDVAFARANFRYGGEMNYNHDTEMELDWAQSSTRKKKLYQAKLPDGAVRKATLPLRVVRNDISSSTARAQREGGENSTIGRRSRGAEGAEDEKTTVPDPEGNGEQQSLVFDGNIGGGLSALAVHLGPRNSSSAASAAEAKMTVDALLEKAHQRDGDGRTKTRAEIVSLRGIDLLLQVLRLHRKEAGCSISVLRLLGQLARTETNMVMKAGACDLVLDLFLFSPKQQLQELDPPVLCAALHMVHALTFDAEAKKLLLRRGLRGLAGELADTHKDEDVLRISRRLLQRLPEGLKGYSNVYKKDARST